GDLNGDGRLDLALANFGGNNLSLLFNQGTGIFGPPVNQPASNGPFALFVGDLNGDGRADIASANFNANNVGLYLNQGAGSFTVTSYSAGINPSAVTAGD